MYRFSIQRQEHSRCCAPCLELPIEAEPGTRAEYSDPGFILLGKALEVLTAEPLARWVAREVFAPLGMHSTRFCPTPASRHAIPPTEEDELFRQRRIQGEVQDEHAYLLKGAAGHAGLFSNVPDLLRFSAQILHPRFEPKLFAPATIDLFAQRQPPPGSSRALGWDTPSANSSSGKYFSVDSVGHLGYSGCSLWIDREAEIAIVLLTNRTWPHRQSQLIRTVRPAFHDALRLALSRGAKMTLVNATEHRTFSRFLRPSVRFCASRSGFGLPKWDRNTSPVAKATSLPPER